MMHYALVTVLALVHLGFGSYKDHREPPIWTPAIDCPASINATLPRRNINKTPAGDYAFPKSTTIHNALTTCPNIESLNLRIATLGCTGHPDRWSLPFNLSGGDNYPPLKYLSLERYHFYTRDFEGVRPPKGIPGWDTYWSDWVNWIFSDRARQWLEWRELPETQSNKTNAELWADAMDWSKLISLELHDIDSEPFVTHIGPFLTGLKELTLHRFYSMDENSTHQWFRTLPPLRNFAWFNGRCKSLNALDPILERHGETLESLSIHGRGMSGPGPYLSIPEIERIGKMAPNLKHLAIAVDRNGTWPYDTLDAIANNSQLETADLWMQYVSEKGYNADKSPWEDGYEYIEDIQYRYQENSTLYQKPLLDRPGIEELWKSMKARSNNGLKKVSFYAGDFTRSWDGPLYFRRWMEQLRVGWACDADGCEEVDRRDDILHGQSELDDAWDAQWEGHSDDAILEDEPYDDEYPIEL
ncbi:MAG: hypothetical protein M1820_004387 [Bogoriella megaspora]|nr:MAG: hypothetical protein M1820_004387 [Bogoriella megaspora]